MYLFLRLGTVALLAMGLALTAPALAESPLKPRMVPKELRGTRPGQLEIRVAPSTTQRTLSVDLVAPPGFSITPAKFEARESPQGVTRLAVVQAARGQLGSDPRLIELRVSDAQGGAVVASETFEFNYRPELPLGWFLVVALGGIALGYGLRLLLQVLSTVPPPKLAQAQEDKPQEGWLSGFVRRHYYQVDFGTTVVLALLALFALSTNDYLPDVATSWSKALIAGFGLGLLTNSELLIRLRPR